MKKLHPLLLGLALVTPAIAGETLNDADQKWSAAIEKIIAAGNTTISTPSEKRVQIAKEVAEKAGRKIEVSKSENSYRIKVF
jgi:rRNA maturation endonuclease Nob1